MVLLRVLLDHGDLFNRVDLCVFSQRCRRYMLQHPVLRRDLLEGRHALDHQQATDEQWGAWWRQWPIDRWLDVQNGQRWFSLDGELLGLTIDCPEELRSTLESMTEELVDWRLAAYSKSHRLTDTSDLQTAFEAKVSHSGGRPILFLPDKAKQPGRPQGLVEVRLPDGSLWEFKLVKVACNVAKPKGGTTNELGELLRSWFGSNAGLPGTDFKVLFELKQDQWSARPLGVRSPADAATLEPPVAEEPVAAEPGLAIEPSVAKRAQYRTHVPVYDLIAAASGFGDDGAPEAIGWVRVADQAVSPGMFAAQVIGESMRPRIPSGAWCLFRPCPAGSRQDRLVLVQLHKHFDPEDGGRYTVKKYRSTKQSNEDGWEHQTIELVPLNPEYQPLKISAEDAAEVRVIGEFVRVLG
ncbi:MAG: S24 family peptidase [Pirellulaceae bacterium]